MKEIKKKEFTGIFKEEFENFLRNKNALEHYRNVEGSLYNNIFNHTSLCEFY